MKIACKDCTNIMLHLSPGTLWCARCQNVQGVPTIALQCAKPEGRSKYPPPPRKISGPQKAFKPMKFKMTVKGTFVEFK